MTSGGRSRAACFCQLFFCHCFGENRGVVYGVGSVDSASVVFTLEPAG